MEQSAKRRELVSRLVGRDIRGFTTAAVLFHHALADQLGLGPTDLKCYDLLRERGSMTGTDLAALTGLTTGGVTGVVARLEHAGLVRRAADRHDGRKQVLSAVAGRPHGVHGVFQQLHGEVAAMLEHYNGAQLSTVADFLSRTTALLHRQIAHLRSARIPHEPARQPAARRHT